MPRRASARTNTSVQEPPLHSLVSSSPEALITLRSHWKWAAFSQFFYTFAPLLAMSDVALADIETDLVAGQNAFLPRVMTRLLYTLSYDRKVSLDNWQTTLRKQYNKRDPQANPIGQEPTNGYREETPPPTPPPQEQPGDDAASPRGPPITTRDSSIQNYPDQHSPGPSERVSSRGLVNHISDKAVEYQEPKDWLDLPMLAKLDSMYLVSEWQFHNPTRLRTLMKSDDETASWRIEPVGYDSKRNAYWFIGDRLWIQRHIPSPPKTRKRKRSPVVMANKTNKARPGSAKRPKVEIDNETRRGQTSQPAVNGGRSSRKAKAQANLKLDAQAKELAELNRQAQARARATRQTKAGETARGRPLGTRLSARLRGAPEDDWQPIPDEWLAGDAEGSLPPDDSPKVDGVPKTGLESDDAVSDLTDLTEESEKEEPVRDEIPSREPSPTPPQNALPEGFVEWETICVTLFEWEHVAERFEKATHYAEKALYKLLVNSIVPFVTEEMREVERKIRLEEALVHRKRSSRIAIKESEKEEARAAERKRAEEEEKMSRARRMELRQQKEEADRLKREAAREQRRQEREAKEAEEKTSAGENMTPNPHTNGGTRRSRPPEGDWELDCEICHVRGLNLDDGTLMMSCGHCSKWQHITCHDRADERAGRPKRNWDMVEFVCERCQIQQQQPAQILLQQPPTVAPQLQYPNGRGQYPHPIKQHNSPALAFSHYQPQHRGFSSTPQPPGGHTDPPAQRYFQAPTAYGQSAWSVTTPTISVAHHASAERSGAVDYRQPYHTDSRHAPPPTQFRYHPTSYGA